MKDYHNERIVLTDWKFWGCHGAYAGERDHKQEFKVDIILYLDLSLAAKSDNLEDTVDYAELYLKIKDLVESASFALLETLTRWIMLEIFKEPLITHAQVGITKLRAKAGEDYLTPTVIMEKSREELGL